MISREVFAKAMKNILEHHRQFHKLMSLDREHGLVITGISEESAYDEALEVIFENAFGMSSSPLDWWLYECHKDEFKNVSVGGEIISVADPAVFYDMLVQHPELWESWYTRKDAPHYPVAIDKLTFRKVTALVREQQNEFAQIMDELKDCGNVFFASLKPSLYMEAILLLLEDMFSDAKGLLRWYLTKDVDHKVWIQDEMYDINEPDDFYIFLQTKASALPQRLA